MKTTDFGRQITSSDIRENLEKQFGVNVDLEKYDREQLEDIRNKLRTRIFQHEGQSKINDLLTNETYQKDKAMLELLNTRIKEMLGEQMKKLRDKMDALNEGKKAKPDFLDMDKDGDKKEPMKKAVADKKKMCPGCKKPINLCGCKGKEKKVKEAFPVPGETKEKSTGKFEKTQGPKGTVYKKKAETTKPSKNEKDLDEGKAHAKDCDCKECMQQEGKMPMKKVGGKSVPAFAADGKGKNDLEKKKGSAPKKGVNPFAKKKVDESNFKHNVKFVNESIQFLLAEDEEGKAKAITAAGDIVNDFTSWMQRVGQYQTKSMIELADAIRADFGAAEAEAFKQSVGPALGASLEVLTQQREAISNAVATLAGESVPVDQQMGAEPAGDMDAGLDSAAPDEMNPEPGADLGDEFGAADAAAGGPETSGRAMRESREVRRARKLAEAHSIISKLAK
jgi:hypothetical protein